MLDFLLGFFLGRAAARGPGGCLWGLVKLLLILFALFVAAVTLVGYLSTEMIRPR